MRKTIRIATRLCGVASVAWAVTTGAAAAGPCTQDIAELGRTLSQSPALGGTPTTGALTGAGPGSAPPPSAAGGAQPPTRERMAGTTADQRQGGTAGTRELNAVVGNQLATSPEDVRRQQQGLPTTAAVAEDARRRTASDRASVETAPAAPGSAPGPDDRASRAKAELETARVLDERNDRACMDAIGRVRRMMQGG